MSEFIYIPEGSLASPNYAIFLQKMEVLKRELHEAAEHNRHLEVPEYVDSFNVVNEQGMMLSLEVKEEEQPCKHEFILVTVIGRPNVKYLCMQCGYQTKEKG
jgi:hypothetical protein